MARTAELLSHLDGAIQALGEVGSAPAVFEHELVGGMVAGMQAAETRLKAAAALAGAEDAVSHTSENGQSITQKEGELAWLDADVAPELLEKLDQAVPLHPDMYLVEQLKQASKAHQKDWIVEDQLKKMATGVLEGTR
jgi:hypothetical protein